jgi:mRNA interferase RelE/StbE
MPVYHVRILSAAARELSRLDRPTRQRVIERIHRLADNLENIRHEVLSGKFSGLYKLRVGEHRVVYEISHTEQILMIHLIGHRREIYKKRKK